MRILTHVLLASALLAATGAIAAEKKRPMQTIEYRQLPEQRPTARQLVQQAKKVTADVFNNASVSVSVDEHDLVVEFRVLEGDERLRESIQAYIDTVADHGEREKMQREILFNPDTLCTIPPLDEDHERTLVACRFYRPFPPATLATDNK